MVARYIAITASIARQLALAAGVPENKIKTVHYGYEVHGDAFSRSDIGLPENAFVVGFVGRLVAFKNVFAFIEAMAGTPDVTGVIVGGGPQYEDVRAASAQVPNVIITGPIPGADRVMPCFDLLCVPSLNEGLGLVLIEAMLRRTPILGSRRGAIPEILRDGQLGALCEPDPQSISDAVRAIRADIVGARARAEMAMEIAKSYYSVNRMVAETNSVYEELQ
jgi:glycosyltransferase involved in cell wall biosynthesis